VGYTTAPVLKMNVACLRLLGSTTGSDEQVEPAGDARRRAVHRGQHDEGAEPNADLLDGVDSGGFIQGAGTSQAVAVDLQPGLGFQYALLTVPGLAGFTATCTQLGQTTYPGEGALDLHNISGGTLDVTHQEIKRENTIPHT